MADNVEMSGNPGAGPPAGAPPAGAPPAGFPALGGLRPYQRFVTVRNASGNINMLRSGRSPQAFILSDPVLSYVSEPEDIVMAVGNVRDYHRQDVCGDNFDGFTQILTGFIQAGQLSQALNQIWTCITYRVRTAQMRRNGGNIPHRKIIDALIKLWKTIIFFEDGVPGCVRSIRYRYIGGEHEFIVGLQVGFTFVSKIVRFDGVRTQVGAAGGRRRRSTRKQKSSRKSHRKGRKQTRKH